MTKETIGKYRWTICSLLFFATTINYLDRSVISLLKNYLEKDFNWTESDYSNIVIAFQLSYAIGLLFAGMIIDKLGTKIGYALSIALWSLAAIGHSLVRSTFGFMTARAALGVSEAGNFPAAIKTTAEWFPKKERALATGIFNSGANIGAIIAPLTVPFIAEVMGWRWAFILTGITGFIWLIFWLLFYKIPSRQKRLSKEEFDYIQDGESGEVIEGKPEPFFRLIRFRQTWAIIIGKFLTDPVWWFYLFWIPAFLKAQYNIEGTASALPIALVYTLASLGSVAGGWLPLKVIKSGWSVSRARRRCMLIYALFALPVLTAQYFGSINVWFAVLIIGIATATHQAWSANLFTLISDRFSKKSVASVTGTAGMAGALGGILIAGIAGSLFDHYKALGHIETGYHYIFIFCAFAYLIAWLIIRALIRTE